MRKEKLVIQNWRLHLFTYNRQKGNNVITYNFKEKSGLEKALDLFYYGNVAEMLLSLYNTEQ